MEYAKHKYKYNLVVLLQNIILKYYSEYLNLLGIQRKQQVVNSRILIVQAMNTEF